MTVPDLLTASQVAAIVGVTPDAIHRAVRSGRLAVAQVTPLGRLFSREAVLAFQQTRRGK